jgi:choline dehydrogenase-like flavoprotein
VPDEPEIADLRRRLSAAGPAPRVASAARRRYRRLAVARATPWDAFPDTTGAKMDAESVGLAEALRHPNVDCAPASRWNGWSWTRRAASLRCLTSAGRIEADQVVLAAGAVHTPVLLLGRPEACPRGSRTGPTRSGATS